MDTALAAAATAGVTTGKIILARYDVRPCLGHDDCASFERCTQDDDAPWILERTFRADAVILASPVYYYNVTAQFKAFIDRTYFYYKHDRRAAARAVGLIIVAEQEGIEDTLHTMGQFADWAFDVPPERRFVVSGYAARKGEVSQNTSLLAAAQALGRDLAAALGGG